MTSQGETATAVSKLTPLGHVRHPMVSDIVLKKLLVTKTADKKIELVVHKTMIHLVGLLAVSKTRVG